jgi:EmrB/QacA subfamily drug resistance transporter
VSAVAAAGAPANRRWLALGAISLGLLSINLDFTVVNLALDDIHNRLGASVSQLQWVMNGYAIAIAATVLIAGRIGDLLGRKRFFMLGLALFAVSAATAAAAPDVWSLIASRIAQGVGAAFLYTLSIALIGNIFPPEERGRAVGIWSGVATSALAIGPLVGGVIVDASSWRWIFIMLVPGALLALVLTWILVPESRDETAKPLADRTGIVTSVVGLVAVIAVLNEGHNWGFSSTRFITLAVVGVSALVAFVARETRSPTPLLDVSLVRNPRFVAANFTSFALTFAWWIVIFFEALRLQDVHHERPVVAGLILLPGTVAISTMSFFSGRIVAKVGTRIAMAVGMLIAAAGCALMPFGGEPVELVALLVTGFGVGLSFAPQATAALNAVPRNRSGEAGGFLLMMRMVGSGFGVGLGGTLFLALGGFPSGFTGALELAGGVLALAAIGVLAFGERRVVVMEAAEA